MIAITEPAPGQRATQSASGSSSASAAPSGTPPIASSCRAPKLHCRSVPTVYVREPYEMVREAVPLPPLNE